MGRDTGGTTRVEAGQAPPSLALACRMIVPRPTARPLRALLLALLMSAVVGSLWPAAAHAENSVAKSTPAANSSVDVSPTSIDIVFTEPVGPSNQVSMTCGPEATAVSLGAPQILVDGATLRMPINTAAPKGTCTVAWAVTDTNLQANGSGTFSFEILNETITPVSTILIGGATTTSTTIAGTTPTTSGGTVEEPTKSGGSQGALALFRFASTIGIAILLGSIVIIATAWPEGVEYIITVRFLRQVWLATVATTYLFNVALAAHLTGEGIFGKILPFSWGGMFDFAPGLAGFLRLVFVIATGYAVLRPERIIDTASQLPAIAPPVIAVVTMGFARTGFGFIDVTSGIVHSLAMSVWFGGLVLLSRVVLAGPGEEDLVHAVRGFSRIATPALWVTVLTGAVLLFRLDRGALGTAHGMTVILKVIAVSAMVFVGVAARQFIDGRLARADVMQASMAFRLRRALTIEALIGVIVLAITAGLLATTPPSLADRNQPPVDLATPHLFQNQALGIEVTVAFSEKVGVNDVRIELLAAPDGGITGLAVDFIPPADSSVNGMTINTPLTTPGAAVLRKSSGFSLGAKGLWTLRVRTGGNTISEVQVQVNDPNVTTVTSVLDTPATIIIGGTTSTTATGGSTTTATTVAP